MKKNKPENIALNLPIHLASHSHSEVAMVTRSWAHPGFTDKMRNPPRWLICHLIGFPYAMIRI